MYLIVAGDSWANGAELDKNEVPFGNILANKLGATCIHVAEDALSIPHLILQCRHKFNER